MTLVRSGWHVLLDQSRRWSVERIFPWLGNHRRLSKEGKTQKTDYKAHSHVTRDTRAGG